MHFSSRQQVSVEHLPCVSRHCSGSGRAAFNKINKNTNFWDLMFYLVREGKTRRKAIYRLVQSTREKNKIAKGGGSEERKEVTQVFNSR